MSDPLDQPATRHDLAKLEIDLKRDIFSLREELSKLRHAFWLNIVVPSLTLLVSLLIHYLFK